MNNDEIKKKEGLYHIILENDNDIDRLMDEARADEIKKLNTKIDIAMAGLALEKKMWDGSTTGGAGIREGLDQGIAKLKTLLQVHL